MKKVYNWQIGNCLGMGIGLIILGLFPFWMSLLLGSGFQNSLAFFWFGLEGPIEAFIELCMLFVAFVGFTYLFKFNSLTRAKLDDRGFYYYPFYRAKARMDIKSIQMFWIFHKLKFIPYSEIRSVKLLPRAFIFKEQIRIVLKNGKSPDLTWVDSLKKKDKIEIVEELKARI